jgi:ankyrin repeat protein
MIKTNTPQARDFFDAIAKGRIESVRKLVGNAPQLLQAFDYDCFGATPITRICFSDDRPMLKALVELGADVDRRSDWPMGPWSPLHCAVMERNSDLANFLLDSGAKLDAHTAAGLGRLDDLTSLLDEKPDRVREVGGDGCQPLHFADTPAVAQLLLERGADMEARCIDHYSTPVQYLADKRPEVARFLFSQGAKADIFSAILANDEAVAGQLIDENPDVLDARINHAYFPPSPAHDVHNIMTFTVGRDSSPLHAAAKANRPAMVELLIRAGQSPNVRGGYDDATPLHQAAWNDCLAAAKALVERGADIDALSGKMHNNSPAGWAIVAGSADVFEYLMDCGAEALQWFGADAQAAVNGQFRQYKFVPQENYERVLARLHGSSS